MTIWPFWAATSDDRIEDAFDLVGLRHGELAVDLGCGDGRVLLRAAALRGARVRGVELDTTLADSAQRLLDDHGVDGEIVVGDLADPDVVAAACSGAGVVFCYLSPAILQRLAPTLASLPAGTRLVTTGYPVPGWMPQAMAGRVYRFDLPPVPDPPAAGPPGWEAPGIAVTARPGEASLIAVSYRHRGGPVDVRVTSDGAGSIDAHTGMDTSDGPATVVVDVRIRLEDRRLEDRRNLVRGVVAIGPDEFVVEARTGEAPSREWFETR